METTAGQVLLNSVLPPRYRDHSRRYTKATLNELLARIATENPEDYPDVIKKLADVGRTAATLGGGYSFDVPHLRQTAAGKAAGDKAKSLVAGILSSQDLTPEQRTARISAAIGGLVPDQEKAVYKEALDAENPLALQVASGSRGNPSNLLGLIGAPLAYLDNQNRIIPRPVTHSYSQGMTPAQHWAATYGSRKGIVGTKISVADSGYAAKRLLRASHQLNITAHDDDEAHDPESPRGLPVTTDDLDSVGAILAHDVGPYKRDTVISKKLLNHLNAMGHQRILVRSPIVGGPAHGGVSAKAAGLDEFGNLPGMNSAVGSNSANAISEVLSQATLGAKHGGGAVTGKGDAVGGYGAINSLLEVPKQQANGAEHAETDGRVTEISPASVGGHNVMVGGKQHYIAHGLEPLVKVGDEVEAGDVLSSGIPNPAMVVQHKGIGEGRRYFTKAMLAALKASSIKAHRRNVEMVSRGLIDHVRMNSEWGGHFPEDVVPYRTIEAGWVPREGSKTGSPESAVGHYLEKPVLHYSIGTKIRPSVIKDMQEFGVKHVTTHNMAPPFEPEMIRAMDNLSYDPDWMVRAYGSGVQKSFMDAAHRGLSSDTNSVSFVPALAKRVGFADNRQVAPGIKPTIGDSGEMEVPKIASAFDGDACPECGEKFSGSCRCAIGNMHCKQGHNWWVCPKHQLKHAGTGHSADLADSPFGQKDRSQVCLCPKKDSGIPKLAYSGEYANNGYEDAASKPHAMGALHSLDPEAVSTLTGTPFNQPHMQAPRAMPYGNYGAAKPPATPAPSTWDHVKNFVSSPGGAVTAGVGLAGAGYLASRAMQPSTATMASQAAKATEAAGAGTGLWAKTKAVGGKVMTPIGLAIDAYGQGKNYYQGYQQNGWQGAYDAGHDDAMHRFDGLNTNNPLQIAGTAADITFNAPRNINMIGHAAVDTARAGYETGQAATGTYQAARQTGQYNPMEAKRYQTPGQLLEDFKKSPYAPVEAATEQLYNFPAAAGAAAKHLETAQSEAARNRQLTAEINQKRIGQGLLPINDVPEWTGNNTVDQTIESVTNRPTAVGSGLRQLVGGSGNAVNPVTGAPIRPLWSYFGL